MFRSSSLVASGMFALATLSAVPACNDSKGYDEPSTSLRIVSISGPKDNVVHYDPDSNSGACPLPLGVTFRLPEDQAVSRAYVRFQGDGNDVGVDRGFLVEQTYGKGLDTDASVTVHAAVPQTILRTDALFTYSVRLVTANGDESPESTLTVTVQKPPKSE